MLDNSAVHFAIVGNFSGERAGARHGWIDVSLCAESHEKGRTGKRGNCLLAVCVRVRVKRSTCTCLVSID